MPGHRNHSDYKGAHQKHVVSADVRMPPTSGFRVLKGSVSFFPQQHTIRVVIVGERTPQNNAPGFMKRVSRPWKDRTDVAGMREQLEVALNATVQDVLARRYPEVDFHLDRCNTAGVDVETFLLDRCSTCTGWYCELSGG